MSLANALRSAKELVRLWATEAGPFVRAFYALMDSFNLQRQAYHSGALVGNDVHRILQPDAIHAFAQLLMPRLAAGACVCYTTHSSSMLSCACLVSDLEVGADGQVHLNVQNIAGVGKPLMAEKYKEIFTTFGAIASLIARKEPLCEHELDHFDIVCDKFAVQFSLLFPELEVLPRGHVLLYHMGPQMRWFGSTGMLHEGVVEALHVVDNRLVLRYGNVKNQEQNIHCRAQAHWQLADPGGPPSIRSLDYLRELRAREKRNHNSRQMRAEWEKRCAAYDADVRGEGS